MVPRVEARLAAGAAAVEGVAEAAVDARMHVRAGRAASVAGVSTAAAAAGDRARRVGATVGEALGQLFSLSLSCTPLSGDALRAVGRCPFFADGRNLSALQQQTGPPPGGSLARSSSEKLARLTGSHSLRLVQPATWTCFANCEWEKLVRSCSSSTVYVPTRSDGCEQRQQ